MTAPGRILAIVRMLAGTRGPAHHLEEVGLLDTWRRTA
jgi:hypothetical protein